MMTRTDVALGYLARLENFHPCHFTFWSSIPFSISFSHRFLFLPKFHCYSVFFFSPFFLPFANVWERVCTWFGHSIVDMQGRSRYTHSQTCTEQTGHPNVSVVILSNYILTSLISLPREVRPPTPTPRPTAPNSPRFHLSPVFLYSLVFFTFSWLRHPFIHPALLASVSLIKGVNPI